MAKKKLYYKIGEACRLLDIQPYVLRYWETEFPALSPSKSKSGQRVYGEADFAVIRRIKELLYEEGFTIAGAKKKLNSELAAGGPQVKGEEAAAPSQASAEKPATEAESAAEPKEAEQATPAKKIAKKKKVAKKAAAAKSAQKSAESDAEVRKAVQSALKDAKALLKKLQ